MTRLSITSLQKAQPGDELWDDQVPGLHARVRAKRTTFFLFFRTPDKKPRRPKIGDYGVITLPQAREIARTWAFKNVMGEPIREPLNPSQAATVADLYAQWQVLHKPKLKPETARGQECQWKVHILPRLGKDRVAEVTDDDIASLHAEISEEHPTQANRVLALLGTAFKMAEKRPLKWRPQNSNPCYGIDRNKETKRKRYLSIEELQRLGAVLYEWENRGTWWQKASRYFRLLIMTGARKSEIGKAKRSWLDLDKGILLLSDHKTSGQTGEKVLALPQAAVRLIRQMIADEPHSEWLCPGKLRGQPINNHYNAWCQILEEAGIENLRIHDLRHSFASVGITMHRMNLKEIGSVLGHTDVATTERYTHLMLPQHIAYSEAIGSTIERLMLPAPADAGTVTATDAEPLSVVA